MVAPDQINDQTLFSWSCLQSAQKNGGKINFSDVSDYHKIKCQAGYMRFHRLAKAIEAAGGVPNGGGDTPLNKIPASVAAGRAKKRKAGKGDAGGAIKDEESHNDLEPPSKKPKLSTVSTGGVKIEGGEEAQDSSLLHLANGDVAH